MKIHVLLVLFLALIFNSCKKKPLPPDEEEPASVFYFKGDIGGSIVSIYAGLNSYYMSSSYFQDSNSVYVFKSELKQKECKYNCGYGISVLINDYKASPSYNMYIDSTLILSNYQYNDGSIMPLFYKGNFTPRQTAQNVTNNWTFSDGNTYNTINCVRSFKANTSYTASLLVTSSDFGSISHENVYKIGNPVQANINTIRISPINIFNYQFSVTGLTGIPPFTYLWDFGDGFTSTQPSPSHEFLVSGLYRVKLTVVDANNETFESYYQIPAFNGTIGEANFNAFFTPIQNLKALSAITILINDPQGKVYSSALVNQTANQNFEIVSIENYKPQDSNQLFKKIKIKFNCTVVNGSNSIAIKGGEAVIAVAYKN
jgi:PKD repeat protein